MNAATTGFIMIAIAFPVYLLWKGELPGYLKFMTGGTGSISNNGNLATPFSVTPSVTGPLGPAVMGTPGSGSGAAGSPLPIPGL